jgi:hypothetical protein
MPDDTPVLDTLADGEMAALAEDRDGQVSQGGHDLRAVAGAPPGRHLRRR